MFVIHGTLASPVIQGPSNMMYLTKPELEELSRKYCGGTLAGSGLNKAQACEKIFNAIVDYNKKVMIQSNQKKEASPVKEELPTLESMKKPPKKEAPENSFEEPTIVEVQPEEKKEEPAQEKRKTRTRKSRTGKKYTCQFGDFDDDNDSEILLDIKESIEALLEDAGEDVEELELTAKKVMDDCVENGERFDFSKSTQTPEKLFQRNVPALKESGWIIE